MTHYGPGATPRTPQSTGRKLSWLEHRIFNLSRLVHFRPAVSAIEPVEGRDPGADMPKTVSGAMWRPQIARSPSPGRQITIDGIGGWCYGSVQHRRPANQGARCLKWETSARMTTSAPNATAVELKRRGLGAVNEPVPRIMVVEDSPDFQEVVVESLLLEPYTWDIHVVASGEEALAALAEASPDLVLLDFRLPGIDGLETAKRMKEQRPDVKIVLVTAYAEEVFERAAKEANVEEVIPKADFTVARVHQLLGRDS